MSFVRAPSDRGQPFYWWGAQEPARPPDDLRTLVVSGRVPDAVAALLTELVARGLSLIISSSRSQAGKSTLLRALIDAAAPQRRVIYPRGSYESFTFLQSTQPHETCLAVNEISPHLPVYLWGPGVRKLFDARAQGYQVLATMHGANERNVALTLTSPPLSLPLSLVATPSVVVSLAAPDGRLQSLTRIAFIEPGPGDRSMLVAGFDSFDGEPRSPMLDAAGNTLELAGLASADLTTAVAARLESFGRPTGAHPHPVDHP